MKSTEQFSWMPKHISIQNEMFIYVAVVSVVLLCLQKSFYSINFYQKNMLASSLERTPFYFPAPTFLSFFFLFLRDPKIRSKKDIRVFQGQDFCYQYQKWLHLQACKIGSRPLEEKFFGMSSGPGYLVIRIHLAICFWSLHSWRYSKAI